jgi:hypothetical protein
MPDIKRVHQESRNELEKAILQATRLSNRILAEGRKRGVVLRLVGGLAVHEYCREHSFCDRNHGDLDLVGLSSQYEGIVQVMTEIGFRENKSMTIATGASRLLFEKPRLPDHIDVFLDHMNIEHDIDLKDRLEIEESTISVSDLILGKLTITRLNEKDIRDIITLVKDLKMGLDDSPGTINMAYIGGLCAKKWGLNHDVSASIRKVLDFLPRYALPKDDELEVAAKVRSMNDAILKAHKSLRWRVRALVGERIPWRREIETMNVTTDDGDDVLPA